MTDLREDPTKISNDNIHFGESLKQERLRHGLSLEEISKGTGINLPNLLALEDGARRKLPADVFNRGFIKLYAKYLQIDPGESLDRYEKEWGFTNGIDGAPVYLTGGAIAEPTSIVEDKQALAFIGIVVLVAAIFLAFQFFPVNWSRNNRQEQLTNPSLTDTHPTKESSSHAPIPIAPLETQVVQESQPLTKNSSEQENIDHEGLYSTHEKYLAEDNAPTIDREEEHATEQVLSRSLTKPQDVALPEPLPHKVLEEVRPAISEATRSATDYTLVANFSERTWLKITIDNNSPAEYTFRSNEKHTWKATETFHLLIGNAGGVALFLDGKKIEINRGSGQVLSLTLPYSN